MFNPTPSVESHIYSGKSLPPMPEHWLSLGHAFLHQARQQPDVVAVYDSFGVQMTYRETLERSIALAGLLRHELAGCRYVGILLPPSAAAVVTNLALTFLDKIVVNLNYTASQTTFDSCVERCGLTHIITSEKVLKRTKLQSTAEFMALESMQSHVSLSIKAYAWMESHAVPEFLLGLSLPGLSASFNESEHDHLHHIAKIIRGKKLDEVAAIVFTTGSTSEPKGVMLTHRNILSNIWALQTVAKISAKEVVLGVVPFFHSFGFTLTLWAVMTLGHTAVYHYNPLDAKVVASLCEKYKASVLFCTPTILKGYINRCLPEQFKTIRFCILGGEKMSRRLELDIRDKLGICAMQGYGLTETSPVVASNIPWDYEFDDGTKALGHREGTVGFPFPGTKIKIMDLATGDNLAPGKEGLIAVQGPQVMKGYLGDRMRTLKVLGDDGWFVTGDLGFVDNDGFLTVTGRLSQFAKIAGEMVPHLGVEEEIIRVAQLQDHSLAVTSIPDVRRGERLAVVYTDKETTPQSIVDKLKETGISRLWIPDAADFVEIDELPVLPTGKLDLLSIKKIAEQRLCDNPCDLFAEVRT